MTHFDNAAAHNGFEAAYAGLSLEDNPFSTQTSAGKSWVAGYEQALRNQGDGGAFGFGAQK